MSYLPSLVPLEGYNILDIRITHIGSTTPDTFGGGVSMESVSGATSMVSLMRQVDGSIRIAANRTDYEVTGYEAITSTSPDYNRNVRLRLTVTKSGNNFTVSGFWTYPGLTVWNQVGTDYSFTWSDYSGRLFILGESPISGIPSRFDDLYVYSAILDNEA